MKIFHCCCGQKRFSVIIVLKKQQKKTDLLRFLFLFLQRQMRVCTPVPAEGSRLWFWSRLTKIVVWRQEDFLCLVLAGRVTASARLKNPEVSRVRRPIISVRWGMTVVECETQSKGRPQNTRWTTVSISRLLRRKGLHNGTFKKYTGLPEVVGRHENCLSPPTTTHPPNESNRVS